MTELVQPTGSRTPLTKERVLDAAIELADRDGIDGLSMRRLGQELGVEAMALYRHVRDKEDLLDGAVEAVIAGIETPPPSDDWKRSMRDLALASRRHMLSHPWAPALIVKRTTVGPATLRHIDLVLGILSGAGFSIDMAHHALHVLGSRVFGFTQDPFNDATDADADAAQSAAFARSIATSLPHVAELAVAASHDGTLGGCDDDVEFAFGLDLVLDGLERLRAG